MSKREEFLRSWLKMGEMLADIIEDEPEVVVDNTDVVETVSDDIEICGRSKVTPKVRSDPGPFVDEDGNILRVSTLKSDPAYDPELAFDDAKLAKLKIYCDGKLIETAHTADVSAGEVYYYKKNEKGRIRTEVVRGQVEIRGL